TGPEGTAHTWALPTDRHSYRQLVHAKAGDLITLPYVGSSATPSRDELALFELRGEAIRADRFDALAVNTGLLELRGLEAADYELWLKRSGERIHIRVVDGPVVDEYVLGKLRHMELPGLKPVQIAAISADDEALTIRLKDASKFARVHVFATRYRAAYDAYAN